MEGHTAQALWAGTTLPKGNQRVYTCVPPKEDKEEDPSGR
jgi:hypothetical protein